MELRAIFFDVGGTLLKAHPSVGGIYAEVASAYGVDVGADVLNRRFEDVWKRRKAERSAIDKNWWRALVGEIFQPFCEEMRESFFEDLYDSFKNPNAWMIYPDVWETLNALKEKRIRMAVASNWDERLPDLLDKLNLTPFFEERFISHFVGRMKPDVEFFKQGLQKMKLEGAHVLHVGDDEVEDVQAARAAGLHARLINRKKPAVPNERLSDLRELLNFVRI